MLQKLQEFLDSPEGQASIEKFAQDMAFKEELQNKQRIRMRKMYHDQESFDILMEKICAKHNDAYVDRCYSRGYMPYPMNILGVIHDIADHEGVDHEPLDSFTEGFPSDIVTYMGWQFAVTHGQGSVTSVYKGKELIVRL